MHFHSKLIWLRFSSVSSIAPFTSQSIQLSPCTTLFSNVTHTLLKKKNEQKCTQMIEMLVKSHAGFQLSDPNLFSQRSTYSKCRSLENKPRKKSIEDVFLNKKPSAVHILQNNDRYIAVQYSRHCNPL